MTAWTEKLVRYWVDLYEHKIWQTSLETERRPVRVFHGLLRVVSITLTGLDEIRIFSRAAALSYSSLLGIGPLIAIGVLVAGTILHNGRSDLAVEALNKTLRFIAPQIDQLERNAEAAGAPATVAVNQKLVDLLNNFIAGSRSGTLGIAGALTLVIIVIQLFISVEESFNSIWGVRHGRPLVTRIMMYWTLVTLGAVLALAALSVLSAATFAQLFDNLPWGQKVLVTLRWSGPLAAFITLVMLMAAFYRFIPNTNVLWRPALVGATLVVVLLFLNNYLAFFYVKTVLRSQNLFGPLSILPVLMIGLYFFWLFVLLGGQVTYAVQNVHYRSSKSAWDDLNQTSRESLALLVLVLIARRFKTCLPPFTASELSSRVRVPSQVLNESLNRLIDLRLVTTTPPAANESSLDYHFQPARPLARIGLREFRDRFASLGASPSGERLDTVDPVLRFFHERLTHALTEALGDTTLDELLDTLPPAFEELAAAHA